MRNDMSQVGSCLEQQKIDASLIYDVKAFRERKPKKYVHLESGGQRKETESEETDEAAIKRVEEYVELNFGKNYLSLLEQERKRSRFCKGDSFQLPPSLYGWNFSCSGKEK